MAMNLLSALLLAVLAVSLALNLAQLIVARRQWRERAEAISERDQLIDDLRSALDDRPQRDWRKDVL